LLKNFPPISGQRRKDALLNDWLEAILGRSKMNLFQKLKNHLSHRWNEGKSGENLFHATEEVNVSN
jgi:hypothetical protein